VVNALLREFYSHGNEHPHGWGFADFTNHAHRIEKSSEQADVSPQLAQLLARPLVVTNALAHIRYATIGEVARENSHPFTGHDVTGRQWTLLHKGTVFGYDSLNPYLRVQTGSTDSERILLLLIDEVNRATADKGAPLEADERFELFDGLMQKMSPGNALNLIVYDSDQFSVHANYADALNMLTLETGIVLSTARLATGDRAGSASEAASGTTSGAASDAEGSSAASNAKGDGSPDNPAVLAHWQPVPLCQALAYKRGRLVATGTAHPHQYFDNEQDTIHLYQDYAAL
jgi:glutamine amidotransferase